MDRNFPYAIFNTKFDPARDRNEISKRLLSHNFRISNRKSSNNFYDLLNVETRLILNKKGKCIYLKILYVHQNIDLDSKD